MTANALDTTRTPIRRQLVVALAGAAAAILAIAWAGTRPNLYALHVSQVAPDGYPWRGVLILSSMALAEVLVFGALVRAIGGIGRYLAAAGLSGTLCVLLALGSMHQPDYFLAHIYWLLACCGFFLCLFLAALGRPLLGRARRPA